MQSDTLARRLGATTHLSPLLIKARRLGLHTPEDLEWLAIHRGCEYYNTNPASFILQEQPLVRANRSEFSNAELAVALLSPSAAGSLLRQRMGACMLSAPDVEAAAVAKLAVEENCGGIIHYIANCACEVEPENLFWRELQSALSSCQYSEAEMPHPTRFIEMTGITRGKIGIQKRWLRPIAALALAP
jgi:hypothetical protein